MKSESLLGFIAGAATGALLGILFAPDKGEETRRKIKEAAAEGYDDAKEFVGDAAHGAHVRYRYARKEMNALKRSLLEQGADLKEDVRQALLQKLEQLEKALTPDTPEAQVDEQESGQA
ncbi:MAG: YtxH domain-containing protein [Bacteroidales bacterium]|nr:YtxH domain-containing protein [Bacteroidales bacterium]